VEHPQTNGQVEFAKRVILRELKRKLEEAKGNWTEELPHVLWAYHTTPHSTTGETLVHLTFEMEVMIPVEVKELGWRTAHPLDQTANKEATLEELYFNPGLLSTTNQGTLSNLQRPPSNKLRPPGITGR